MATLATGVAKSARRIVVSGDSMRPTLDPGDRLLVRRTRRPRPGDVVAAVDPRQPTRILLKRVLTITDDGLVLIGDNPDASTDSRHFGPVPWSSVLGVAMYRYAPAARSSRVVRRPVPSTEWPTTASTRCLPPAISRD
ncbi:MAG: hypothetical protein QOG64_2501 [Acidimicrobiaceae bacterium]|nr:hypothetical protein [Acidimicrobiaceae bacterium]